MRAAVLDADRGRLVRIRLAGERHHQVALLLVVGGRNAPLPLPVRITPLDLVDGPDPDPLRHGKSEELLPAVLYLINDSGPRLHHVLVVDVDPGPELGHLDDRGHELAAVVR